MATLAEIIAASTQIYAIIGSTSYCLSDGTISWRVSDADLAMPPVRRLSEQGPLQHGDTDLGFRLDPRTFVLTLKTAQNQTLASLYNNRKQIINIFKPLSSLPVALKYILPNGDTRQIDCNVAGKFQIDEESREGYMQKAVIPLRAPDPTFYDPTRVTVYVFLSTGTFATTIPFAVPFNVGTGGGAFGQSQTITYAGTFQTNPIITITGPATNLIITNVSTNEKLDFTGTTITGTWTIDTRYGFKTVKDGSGVNKISALSDDSSLATFHLDIDPVVPGGGNTINITGSAFGLATQLYVQYYTRYIGI